MKICLINNLYHPYNRGGAEDVVRLQRKRFEEEGWGVRIISSRPFFFRKKDLELKDVFYLPSLFYNLKKIPYFLRIIWHICEFFSFWRLWKIYKILKTENFDLVISHNLKGITWLMPLVVKFLNIKHIHYLHDIQLLHPSGLIFFREENIISSFQARFYQFLNRKLFNKLIVVSPSSWLLNLHLSRGFFKNSSTNQIYNPFDFRFAEDTKKKREVGGFKFLYVGQIEKHKGVEDAIIAFKSVSAPSDIFKIIGEGGTLVDLKKHESKKIIFTGKLSKKDVLKEMGDANCLLAPSSCYENSPGVYYEAMSVNLPVLGSDFGGLADLINEFGGCKISLESGGLESAILEVKKSINKNSIKLKTDLFKKEVSVENYFKKIKKLIK